MTDDLIQKEIEEFRKKFVLSMNKTFFGNPEELKKQGWEVGKDHFIIRQDTTPEEIEQFLSSSLHKIKDEAKREAIEEVAGEYGDFRISKENKKGRALRFYLLPHTKHKEGDDEER